MNNNPVEPKSIGFLITHEHLRLCNLTTSTLAEKMDISISVLLDILTGACPINEEIAIKLAVVFNNTSHFWFDLQKRYDEYCWKNTYD